MDRLTEQVFAITLQQNSSFPPSGASNSIWARQNDLEGSTGIEDEPVDGIEQSGASISLPQLPPETNVDLHSADPHEPFEKLFLLDLEVDLRLKECTKHYKMGMESVEMSKQALEASRLLEEEESWFESAQKTVLGIDRKSSKTVQALRTALLERIVEIRKQLEEQQLGIQGRIKAPAAEQAGRVIDTSEQLISSAKRC